MCWPPGHSGHPGGLAHWLQSAGQGDRVHLPGPHILPTVLGGRPGVHTGTSRTVPRRHGGLLRGMKIVVVF